MAVFARKSIARTLTDTDPDPGEGGRFQRTLNLHDLVGFGIGSTVGVGPFVVTGIEAASRAGPAVALSYALAGVGCLCVAICYGQFARLVPVCGSVYSYAYITLGEGFAWVIGCLLLLEYLVGASLVAVAWSYYFRAALDSFGIHLSSLVTGSAFQFGGLGRADDGGHLINLPAILITLFAMCFIMRGTKVSARVNNTIVGVKVLAILAVIFGAAPFVVPLNWHPFIPPNEGRFGHFGISGVLSATSSLFFAYIGFDSIATFSQETREPEKTIPLALTITLAVCVVLYVGLALIMTGIADYHRLATANPMTAALDALGGSLAWVHWCVNVVTLFGLVSLILVALMCQSRIFYAMGRDGLLPGAFATIHPRFGTPYFGSLVTGISAAILAGLFPIHFLGELVSVGTLLLFVTVSIGVVVLVHGNPGSLNRLRTQLILFVAFLALASCIAMLSLVQTETWFWMAAWLLFGAAAYQSYGARHSKVHNNNFVPEGAHMVQRPGQVTRMLCANAFLGGGAFRQQVIGHFVNIATAPAPEIAIDLEMVVQACLFARRRATQFNWAFLGILLATLVLAEIDLAVITFPIIAAAMLSYRKRWREQRVLVRELQDKGTDLAIITAKFKTTIPDTIRRAMPSPEQNLTVYKGFVPFVGMGSELGGWSFATVLDKPKMIGQANPFQFSIDDLYERLSGAVRALRLDNVTCQDHYFVSGKDLREDRALLPEPSARPITTLSSEVAHSRDDANDGNVRRYQWIRVEDWGGELIFSTVVRCARRGSTLYVEAKRFVLPPLATENRRVDALPPNNIWSELALAVTSIYSGPANCIGAPFALLRIALEHWVQRFRGSRRRRSIASDPHFDYGAVTSLRQLLGQTNYLHYFQKTDTDFYSKIIERKLLDELVQFLDDHNIDTSDIRDRQTTILNSGVWVQGGNVNAEALAVGAGAEAHKQGGGRKRDSSNA